MPLNSVADVLVLHAITELGNRVQSSVDGLTERINMLEALKSDIAAVKSDIAAVKSDFAAVKSDIAAVKSDIAAVNSSVTAATASIATLKSDIAVGFASSHNGVTDRLRVLSKITGTQCLESLETGNRSTLHAVHYGDTLTGVTAAHAVWDGIASGDYIRCGDYDLALSVACPARLTASGGTSAGHVWSKGIGALNINDPSLVIKLGQEVVSYGCGDVASGTAIRAIFSDSVKSSIDVSDSTPSKHRKALQVQVGEHVFYGGAHHGTSGSAVV